MGVHSEPFFFLLIEYSPFLNDFICQGNLQQSFKSMAEKHVGYSYIYNPNFLHYNNQSALFALT